MKPLPKKIHLALLENLRRDNQAGKEENSGLGILIKLIRAIHKKTALKDLNPSAQEITVQVLEEIARLTTRLIKTFSPFHLTPEVQADIIKQVQQEIMSQARGQLLELVPEQPVGENEAYVIDKDQLVVVLARMLSLPSIIQPQILRLNTIIRHFDEAIRRLINDDITLEIKLDSGIGWARFDIQQLKQIIYIVVVNAKESRASGGHLLIETSNVMLNDADVANGEYVCLVVSDSGCGMTDEVKAHLFEPFFTTKGKDHNGLGLATVLGILSLHEGKIRVHSEVDVGTRVEIYLPRLAEPNLDHNPLEANPAVYNLVRQKLDDSGVKI